MGLPNLTWILITCPALALPSLSLFVLIDLKQICISILKICVNSKLLA